MSKYKSSSNEQRAEASENHNHLQKEGFTVENCDGSPGATVSRVVSHDVTVVHEHTTGETFVEEGIHRGE